MRPHRAQSVTNCQGFGFFQMAACAFFNEPLYSRNYNMASNIAGAKTMVFANATQSWWDMLTPLPQVALSASRPTNSSSRHPLTAFQTDPLPDLGLSTP